MKAMHRVHDCVPRSVAWHNTGPCAWLAPKNPQLHQCQRCGYIVWRAA